MAEEIIKVLVDIDAGVIDEYLFTERRSLFRIGKSLESVGCAVEYNQYLSSLSAYDMAIWHHASGIEHIDGFSDCVNFVYANGSLEPGFPIDAVLYSQQSSIADSSYKHLLLKGPFEPSYEKTVNPDDYILVSGGLYPNRNLHIPLLAMKLSNCCCPLRIVYQPRKDYDWIGRDDDKTYYNIFQFYLEMAKDTGVQIIEQSAVSPIEFEDILRKAKFYIFTEETTCNALVCLEALLYGVPLIAPPGGVIDYTNRYYEYPPLHDWNVAKHIGNIIDNLSENYDSVKRNSMEIAESLQPQFTYSKNGSSIKELYNYVRNRSSS